MSSNTARALGKALLALTLGLALSFLVIGFKSVFGSDGHGH